MSISEKERASLASLASVQGFGAVAFGRVVSKLGSGELGWRASRSELMGAGLSEGLVERVLEKRKEIEPEKYLERLGKSGIGVLVASDDDYPENLRETGQAPYVLFVRGAMKPEDELAVAVVGTRRPSEYGRRAAEKLAGELASFGVTVVSGLAFGIDAIAHKAALDAGGRAVAVLGGGIDVITPASNKRLGERVVENGAVVSEYSPGMGALRQTFPARNRIISGLSLGVLVVEGTAKSGSRITAEFAKKQGRLVFAVPGEITSAMSEATNELIKEGAVVVTNVRDILDQISSNKKQFTDKFQISNSKLLEKNLKLDETERKIFGLLEGGKKHVDVLVRESGMGVGEVSSVLTVLEIKGVVKSLGGMVYERG